MGAQATRLSDVKVKAAKPKEKEYILTDGNGLQMRVRINGSKLWNFNYIQPVTKKRWATSSLASTVLLRA